MKCPNHKLKEAVISCTICSRVMCETCNIILAGRNYCQKCADELVKEGAIISLRKLYQILEEKRKHHRIYTLISVELTSLSEEGMSFQGVMHNISSGGMSVLCDNKISVNEVVYLKFTLPDGSKMENLQAGVVRSEKIGEKFNLGLLFMNMVENQKIIDDFVGNSNRNKYSKENTDIINQLL